MPWWGRRDFMKKIVVFADSACDLDGDYLEGIGVRLLPLGVHFGSEDYKDRVGITTKEFYEKLKSFNGVPTTSQVSLGAFQQEFKSALDEGYHVIYPAFSSKLSGTYQASCIAKDALETEDIDTVDTKCASVGLGLVVREAGLMAKKGKSREEILDRVIYMSERMEHIVGVGSLEMLKRGGRISTAQAVMGNLLNVKPMIQMQDGSLVPFDKVRGQKGIIKKLIDTMKERGHDIENQVIGLCHAANEEFCMELKGEIEKTFGVKEFVISEIGAAVGSHIGPGTVAVFFLRK
jgi:DegV family protein with EDD domain